MGNLYYMCYALGKAIIRLGVLWLPILLLILLLPQQGLSHMLISSVARSVTTRAAAPLLQIMLYGVHGTDPAAANKGSSEWLMREH